MYEPSHKILARIVAAFAGNIALVGIILVAVAMGGDWVW